MWKLGWVSISTASSSSGFWLGIYLHCAAAIHPVSFVLPLPCFPLPALQQVDKGDPGFSYAPKRSPAWCDRVLAKSALPHKPGICSEYYTSPQICSSDHKPVTAVLSLPLATETVTSGALLGTCLSACLALRSS